jgi:site-specific DNA-cytosine methylase
MKPTYGRSGNPLSVVGLFAGIGGFELGFQRSGHEATMLCEVWEPAQNVLRTRFPDVPLEPDVRELRSLPASDVVAAGFPCTDLSHLVQELETIEATRTPLTRWRARLRVESGLD